MLHRCTYVRIDCMHLCICSLNMLCEYFWCGKTTKERIRKIQLGRNTVFRFGFQQTHRNPELNWNHFGIEWNRTQSGSPPPSPKNTVRTKEGTYIALKYIVCEPNHSSFFVVSNYVHESIWFCHTLLRSLLPSFRLCAQNGDKKLGFYSCKYIGNFLQCNFAYPNLCSFGHGETCCCCNMHIYELMLCVLTLNALRRSGSYCCVSILSSDSSSSSSSSSLFPFDEVSSWMVSEWLTARSLSDKRLCEAENPISIKDITFSLKFIWVNPHFPASRLARPSRNKSRLIPTQTRKKNRQGSVLVLCTYVICACI